MLPAQRVLKTSMAAAPVLSFKEKKNTSLMLTRLRIYGIICRLSGCLFIPSVPDMSLEFPNIFRIILYLVYSMLCFSLCLTFLLTYVAQNAFLFSIATAFTKSLLVTLHTVVTLRIIVNFISVTRGSWKLIHFIRKSTIFERTSGFSFYERSSSQERGWSRVRRFLVLLASVNCGSFGAYFIVTNLQSSSLSRWTPIIQVFGVISGILLVVYDSLPYLFLTTTCEVLKEYLHVQLEAFRACQMSKDISSVTEVAGHIEKIRINMETIAELKNIMNAVWQWALLTTCASMVLILCVVLTSLFAEGLVLREAIVAIAYAVHASLSLSEIAFASQSMKDEVSNAQQFLAREAHLSFNVLYHHDLYLNFI